MPTLTGSGEVLRGPPPAPLLWLSRPRSPSLSAPGNGSSLHCFVGTLSFAPHGCVSYADCPQTGRSTWIRSHACRVRRIIPSLGLLGYDVVHAAQRCCWHLARTGYMAFSPPARCPPALPALPGLLSVDCSEGHGTRQAGDHSVSPTVAWQEASLVPGLFLLSSPVPSSQAKEPTLEGKHNFHTTRKKQCFPFPDPGLPGGRTAPLHLQHSLLPHLRFPAVEA